MSNNENRILVANTGSDTLTIIDPENQFKTETIYLYEMIKGYGNDINNIASKIGVHQIVKSKNSNIFYTVNSYHNSIFKINWLNLKFKNGKLKI